MSVLHATRQLAQKIEDAEGRNHSVFTQTLDILNPAVNACCARIGGGHAAFGGIASPLTQTFGLGFQQPFDVCVLGELEAFHSERTASVNVEVCHLADIQLAQALVERGYRITEASNVLARQLGPDLSRGPVDAAIVSECNDEDADGFARLVSRGFVDDAEQAARFHELLAVFCRQPNSACFTAELDSELAGGGVVFFVGGIAILASASTLLKHRGRGVQKALIAARLLAAQRSGCNLAVVTTEPGAISQHNVEKLGFRVLYARTKFTKEL